MFTVFFFKHQQELKLFNCLQARILLPLIKPEYHWHFWRDCLPSTELLKERECWYGHPDLGRSLGFVSVLGTDFPITPRNDLEL